MTSVGMLCIIALGANAVDFSGQMSVEYEYDRSGREVTARIVNGERQDYKYDLRGQLLSVSDAGGRTLESYRYDAAGNIVDKRVLGAHTEYTYDAANQLVKSVTNGVVTNYAYDAAGRMIKEGDREYSYSGLDKVDEIRENGNVIASYSYHTDGQLAVANYSNGKSEEFTWDGLALIGRNEVGYLNEPSITGGNPISANGQTMFNDMLGSTLGVSNGKNFSRTVMTSFGAFGDESSFYTGKPKVDGLGYTFNFRNYRADQCKWQTADPLGYPDGFNNYAYVNNGVTDKIDYLGFFAIRFCDPNNNNAIINSSSDILIVKTSNNNALTETNLYGFTKDGDSVIFVISVGISIPKGMKVSADFAKDTEVTYTPHVSTGSDSSLTAGISEVVIAHEKGHADSFISSMGEKFAEQLSGLNIDESKSPDEIMNIYSTGIYSAYSAALSLSFQNILDGANNATRAAFQDNDWVIKAAVENNAPEIWVKE
ncbi:MAG: hypothetical protein RR034_07270 [Bacteroidales bacterium]